MQTVTTQLFTMRARLFSEQYDARQSGKNRARRIEEVVMYKCPECGELYDWEDEARECCEPKAEHSEHGDTRYGK